MQSKAVDFRVLCFGVGQSKHSQQVLRDVPAISAKSGSSRPSDLPDCIAASQGCRPYWQRPDSYRCIARLLRLDARCSSTVSAMVVLVLVIGGKWTSKLSDGEMAKVI
jgi:hypothetical protein